MSTSDVAEGALLFSPLFAGMFLHGLCIRFRWCAGLAVPVDHGATLRAKRLFGDNKTYRGLLAVACGTGLGFVVLAARRGDAPGGHLRLLPSGAWAFVWGCAVGLGAMLGELPNSAMKRQLGVAPGQQGGGVRGLVFHVLDQVDVLVGGWLVLAWLVWPTPGLLLGSFLGVYLGHQAVTLAGYYLGMRATRR